MQQQDLHEQGFGRFLCMTPVYGRESGGIKMLYAFRVGCDVLQKNQARRALPLMESIQILKTLVAAPCRSM
jgi:hypothetical protein